MVERDDPAAVDLAHQSCVDAVLRIERSLVKRAGTPEEVAEAVGFLAAPGAGYITGQLLGVNGGMVLGR